MEEFSFKRDLLILLLVSLPFIYPKNQIPISKIDNAAYSNKAIAYIFRDVNDSVHDKPCEQFQGLRFG